MILANRNFVRSLCDAMHKIVCHTSYTPDKTNLTNLNITIDNWFDDSKIFLNVDKKKIFDISNSKLKFLKVQIYSSSKSNTESITFTLII